MPLAAADIPTVLLALPDAALLARLQTALLAHGMAVTTAIDGEHAWRRLQAAAFDVAVLDAALPVRSGMELIGQLRAYTLLPLVLLLDAEAEADRILGLDLGADDCLARSCNPDELAARVRALRRRSKQPLPFKSCLQLGALRLDSRSLQASLGEQPLLLTHAEFKVLEMLLRAPGQAQSRDDLAARVLGRKATPYNRSIDTHVSHLRHKLKAHGTAGPRIRSVRGLGYMLTTDREPD